MKKILFSISLLILSVASTDAQINKGFKLEFGFNYSNLLFPGIGYQIEPQYVIDDNFSVGIKYEATAYCILCGLSEEGPNNAFDSWSYRKLFINGYYNYNYKQLKFIGGLQFGVGSPSYHDRHPHERLDEQELMLGIILGAQFRRLRATVQLRTQDLKGSETLHPNITLGFIFF